MSSAALAVGVTISGTFVLMILGVVILICVLNKRNPRRRVKGRKNTSEVTQVQKGTENIKRKAEKLKADKSISCFFDFFSCCSGRRSDGPFPDPPFGLELQDPTSSEITVIWNEPEAENQTVPIFGYNIYKRLKTNADDWTKVGKVKYEELEFRVTDLVPNKTYVFGVSSRGKNGESVIVESQPAALKKDPVRPGAPADLDVTDKTSSSITLTWKPPRKSGYSRIHTYHVMIKDWDKNADWTQMTSLPAFDRFMDYKVTGLKPKHPYRFRVNAENVAGLGPYAETITHETADIEPEPPGKPRGPIKYGKITHSSITLSWRPPEQDGGKPVSGYAVEYKEKSNKRWQKAGVCEADKTRLTVAGLQEDIEYIFRVVAVNVVGNSNPLIGPKVRTRLLEIPLSRRSSFRLPSRDETSRDSSRRRHSDRGASGEDTNRANVDVDGNTLKTKLEGLDPQLEADPFVPKSDFFSYDETDTGNISNRHSENKTRHSQFSPLPADPQNLSAKRSEQPQTGKKHWHSDFSPLPNPQPNLYSNVRLREPGDSYESDCDSQTGDDSEDENINGDIKYPARKRNNRDRGTRHRNGLPNDSTDMSQTNTQSSILTEFPNFNRSRDVVRHQPTPSNIAFTHSRF